MMKKVQNPGSRQKATASDVARRAGVSKWTVSRAFTEGASISATTRKLVLASAKELGYRPNLLARSLSQKSSHIIGIVVDQLGNPNLNALLDEVTQQLQSKGYMALLLNITSESSYESAMTLADQLQIDGLLFLGTVLSDELIALAQDIHHIPLVQLYRNNNNPLIPVVSTDGYQAGQHIAQLLYDEGYRKFGYMIGPNNDSTPLLRFEGYRDALSSRGSQVITTIYAHHYQRHSGYEALLSYLQTTPIGERIDALFCENDIIAVGAIDALSDFGGLHNIGIVGFDDIDLASASAYQLTTYAQPMKKMVADAISRIMQPHKTKDASLYTGELKLRRSHLRIKTQRLHKPVS
ncbi:LacI family DNA-binding transcriptional regulator [Sodalis sp. RH21]|uniref:LacI family DNA-binding transcriptional regulator n=1 Tax=unclassified Sodalis (in: enterobacteria) TaxID=2636512 RepID=UPI0039B541D1